MRSLSICDCLLPLDDLAAQIRKSSNFRFAWQFYQVHGTQLLTPADARWALELIIEKSELHQFLKDSFDQEASIGSNLFDIGPLHEQSVVVSADGEFEDIFARAAGDHLGAYSKSMRRTASTTEKQSVKAIFGSIGDYRAFQLIQGASADYNSHLFTTWFDCVAWDWCLMASWPMQQAFWLGCLTDTH